MTGVALYLSRHRPMNTYNKYQPCTHARASVHYDRVNELGRFKKFGAPQSRADTGQTPPGSIQRCSIGIPKHHHHRSASGCISKRLSNEFRLAPLIVVPNSEHAAEHTALTAGIHVHDPAGRR